MYEILFIFSVMHCEIDLKQSRINGVCSRMSQINDLYRPNNMQGLEVNKMRKNILLLSSLMFIALASAFIVLPSEASISTVKWLEPNFSGTDDFYGGPAVAAYAEGSTVKLSIVVTNSPYSWINVSWVRIWFDWGLIYNSTEATGVSTPIEINSTRSLFVFNIVFTAPSTAQVSNLIKHSYTIAVSFSHSGGDETFTLSGSDFAIYSTAQAEAQALNQQVDAYPTTWSFSSTEAEVLWEKARNEAGLGDTYYSVGAFSSAWISYQQALDLFQQAFEAEKVYQTATDTAERNYFNALADSISVEAQAATKHADADMKQADAAQTEAEAALRQTDAALTNAYGWMAFGIGWILIGVGVIVYGLRRPVKPLT